MLLPLRLMHVMLVAWIVAVGVAYVMGTSPVYALIGTIIATTSILARGLIKKAS